MFKKHFVFSVLLVIGLMLSSAGTRILTAKGASEERERAAKAADALSEIMGIPEGGIPNDLMARAEAVAVFPHVVKGAFGIGGEFGKGLVSERMANGKWSAPSYLKIGGGNFGLQLGVSATDLVLVFTDRNGFQQLLDGKVKLGADIGVAAGPVGRNAQAATDLKLKSSVYAYSRSKGLFAGVALDGSVVSIDESANRDVYGKDFTAREILTDGKVPVNDIVMPFVHTLEKYSPAAARKRTT
jgi:lipid-binding SYLF domain-containing protein